MPTEPNPRAFSSYVVGNGNDSQNESGSSRVQHQSVTIRIPKGIGERRPLTGLSRSHIWRLIKGDSPKVRSICVKKPHARRGLRLVVVSSLLDYIYSQEVDSWSQQIEIRGTETVFQSKLPNISGVATIVMPICKDINSKEDCANPVRKEGTDESNVR